MKPFCSKNLSFFSKAMTLIVLMSLSFQLIAYPVILAHAQLLPNLPAPGTMVALTDRFESPTLLGMTVNSANPLLFEFLVDRGQKLIANDELRKTSDKLVKYFLSAMTIPDTDAWVNLSPYEKDLIMPDQLSSTEMGKTMLEQDYILKQLSASLTNPEKELGKKFWDAVQKKAFEKFGTTDIPMDTFNKVWIVPQKAMVIEKDGFVLIGESQLKVMLEEDYEALNNQKIKFSSAENSTSKLSSEVFRAMILPELEKEINEGETFAPVRQIYHAVILATWFKRNLRESLLGQVYVDKSKIAGIDIAEKDLRQKIYEQYLSAFQKGAYNLIKDDVDAASKETLPRKYFSGGTSFENIPLEDEKIAANGRPSALASQKIQSLGTAMKSERIASASVQLADSGTLAKQLTQQITGRASSGLEFNENPDDDPRIFMRGVSFLDAAYRVLGLLDKRKDQKKVTMLLIGVGRGVAALQLALKYPNLEIVAVNKQDYLWSALGAAKIVRQIDTQKYTDEQIREAVTRIKVEALDIEDNAAVEGMMNKFGYADFDMVLFETNVTMYLRDQIKTIQRLFNRAVKVGGVYAFEIARAAAKPAVGEDASKELALGVIQDTFAKGGTVNRGKINVLEFFTVERGNGEPIDVPLRRIEEEQTRFRPGDQSPFPQAVYQTSYVLTDANLKTANLDGRSSSPIRDQTVKRSLIFSALWAHINDPGVVTVSPRAVSEEINETYSLVPIKVSEKEVESFLEGFGAKPGNVKEQGEARWELSNAFWSKFNEEFTLAAIKAALNIRVIVTSAFMESLRTDGNRDQVALLRQWYGLVKELKDEDITDEYIRGLKDTPLWKTFGREENKIFVAALLDQYIQIFGSVQVAADAYFGRNNLRDVSFELDGRTMVIRVGENIAQESFNLEAELKLLMPTFISMGFEVKAIIFDPNADSIFYNPESKTAIIPKLDLREVIYGLMKNELVVMKSSSAVEALAVSKKGGIDFNPALFDLQIKRDGKGVPLPLPQQDLKNINIKGLYPVIINIQPTTVQDFPFLLSALDQNTDQQVVAKN